MEESKAKQELPLQPLPAEDATGVSGGAGECTTTLTVSANPSIITGAPTPSDALISVYEGAVDATSHVIERVADALKNT